jgi:hypothetical protein
MLQFIDAQSEQALCMILAEEQDQYENWLMLEEIEAYLSNQALESDYMC